MNYTIDMELHKFFNSPITCIARCTWHRGQAVSAYFEVRDISSAFDAGASVEPVAQVAYEFRFSVPQSFRSSEESFARLRAYGLDPGKVAALCEAALRRSHLCGCSLSLESECVCDTAVMASGHEIELSAR